MYFIDVSQDSEIHKIIDLPIKSAVIKIDNDEQQIHNSCTGNKIRHNIFKFLVLLFYNIVIVFNI